ncbi:hypothetical protein J2X68_007721 [Streptomyces sp. 3330]|uniref:hypothetical protein n=1 Tax=Streptomyces sp. 3330 TaxID=2817755 RepID=UPI0028544208|nr:hypothetical protein [Streptomyces sp. 3330]MDR6980979.1 hypothetical protein [Streptomyces sp. 3330]
MLDPQDYTHLVSGMTVAKSDGLTLLTLPQLAGEMAYFRWRWASRPVADTQRAKLLELALNEAVRVRIAATATDAPKGKVKFQVLIDAGAAAQPLPAAAETAERATQRHLLGPGPDRPA